MTFATLAGSLYPTVVSYTLQIRGNVILWGFPVQGVEFQYRIALLSGF